MILGQAEARSCPQGGCRPPKYAAGMTDPCRAVGLSGGPRLAAGPARHSVLWALVRCQNLLHVWCLCKCALLRQAALQPSPLKGPAMVKPTCPSWSLLLLHKPGVQTLCRLLHQLKPELCMLKADVSCWCMPASQQP